MVNFSSSVLYALLATAASAELRHDRRHHQHRRKAPCTTGTLVGASSAAPYAMSNSTTIVGPTGTGNIGTAVSATSAALSTVTVVPVPLSSGAGSSPSSSAAAGGGSPGSAPGSSPSSSAAAGGGSPGSAPGSSPSSSAAAGAGAPGSGASGSGQCALATVTVTAQNTVTVTAGAGGAPGGASSSPAAASSPIAPSSVAVTSSAAAGSGSPKPVSPSSNSSCAHPVSRTRSSSAQASSAAASAASSWSAQASSVAASAASSAAAVSTAQSSAPAQQVAASTSASASSTPTSAAAAAPPAGGKCGLAYTSSNQVGSSSPFNSGNTAWGYNWYYESMGLSEGIEFVPSLQKPEWTSSLVAALPQATGVKYIKSVNEPDTPTGSGGTAISPGDAVQLYTGTLNALSGQYKIGAPAVTSYNTTSGLAGFASGITWLQQFHDACAGNCNVGWVDLHWYADGQNGEAGNAQKQASDFLSYVQQATTDVQALYGSDVEIWITEFSAYPTADTDPQINVDFLKAVLPTLESSAVTRYSYYMAQYLESGSSLTNVGSALFS